MMKTRITALFLALSMVLTLAACGTKFKEGEIKEGVCYDITGIAPDATAMVVEGVEVPMDLYFYWLNYGASYMESFMSYYGMEFDWNFVLEEDKTVLDFVREDTARTVIFFVLVEKLVQEYGLVLEESAIIALEEQRASALEEFGGEEGYLAELANIGVREETFDRVRTNDFLYDAVADLYETEGSPVYPTQEELVAAAIYDGYRTVDHILLSTVDDAYEPLDEETVAAKKAQAEELYAQLSAVSGEELTELFASLAGQYSEDPGRAANPDGYTFRDGEMVEEFEITSAALEVGELSSVIETEYGYHILLKKELNEEEAAELVRDSYFAIVQDQMIENAAVEVNPVLETLDIPSVYEGFVEVQLAALESSEETSDAPDSADPAVPEGMENP